HVIELVFRWLKRPHDAQDFERETRGLLPALYRTAYRLTGQRADAEDLVQDTYLKAFEAYRRTSFTSPDNLRVWMLKILT
ncbi:sigma factor, partial [Acinetobacter baumannii]